MTSSPPDEETIAAPTPPAESLLLNALWKKSRMTVSELAEATELSVGTLHIALSGVRYRHGKANPSAPSDRTLVAVSAVLGVAPSMLRSLGRDGASELLEQAGSPEADQTRPAIDDERVVQMAASAREDLARKVLAAFTSEDLQREIDRRRSEAQ